MRISDWSSDVCSSDLDGVVIPAPCLGVDRLANAAEQAQRRQVMAGHIMIALAHQRADRGRRGVSDVDPMLVAAAPAAVVVGVIWNPPEHQGPARENVG